jgi:hypothetical protein
MSSIHISYDPRTPEVWTLTRPYERHSDLLEAIVVPQGFQTDLASVPRFTWHRFPRWGPWSGAAIVHDWIYRTRPTAIDRLQADRVFRDLMRQDGVPYGDVRILYRAVRNFGDKAWSNSQADAPLTV